MAEEAAVEEVTEETTENTTEDTGAQAAPENVPEFNSFEAFSKLREGIEDEGLRKHAERFKEFSDVVKGHADLRKQLSSAIIPPGKDAKPSEISEYRKKIGVPETIDDYNIPIPEGIDEEVFKSEDVQNRLKSIAEVAHANNVSNDAFAAMIGTYFQMAAEAEGTATEADAEYAKQTEIALKEKWGPRYKSELEFANRGFEYAADQNLEALKELKTADGRMLMDHPLMIEAMNKIGRAVSEDGVSSFPTSPQDTTSLRAELEAKTLEQADAMARGEHRKAQALDIDIMELARKISGDNPVVGDGRMA